jgi:integrase
MDVNAMARAMRRNILGCDKPDKRIKGPKGRKKHYAAKKSAEQPVVNKMGLAHFTPHDLRRTCLTCLARLKVPFEVRERIVNHSLGRLEQTYNLHDYDDEKTVAMQRWEGEIKRILTGEVAKVINLKS